MKAAVALALAALAVPGAAGAENRGAEVPARATVGLAAGVFDFTDDTFRAGELGAQYRGRGRWWVFHPVAGAMVTSEGSFNLYAGVGVDVPFGRRLLIRVSFAPSYYHEGGGKPLGMALEFRSSCEIGWRFRDGWRIGLEGYHLSNADLAAHNPGEGSLVVALTIPVGPR